MKLTASDIHVELGGNEILKGIDAAIKEKEFVGIIGPNGSGKSTLLKCWELWFSFLWDVAQRSVCRVRQLTLI